MVREKKSLAVVRRANRFLYARVHCRDGFPPRFDVVWMRASNHPSIALIGIRSLFRRTIQNDMR
jgi:hypothetical protein